MFFIFPFKGISILKNFDIILKVGLLLIKWV